MARRNVREQILDAGLQTIQEKGFNAVGVQEITAAAGVPKGSFYNHFESKEALGAEIVERYGSNSTRHVLLTDPSIPPLERLRRHFDGLNQRFVQSDYTCGCLLGNFSAELSGQSPLIRERLRSLFAVWTKDLERAIQEGQADGSIPTRLKASDLGAFLLDAYEGVLLRARVERDPAVFERFMVIAFGQILA